MMMGSILQEYKSGHNKQVIGYVVVFVSKTG